MDPVSNDIDHHQMDISIETKAVADLNARVGDLQMEGGDMLLDDYDPVDDKPDVAIITPEDSAEEKEPETLANDYDLMKPKVLTQLQDLETESETVHTWELEDWRNQPRKARGPIFECGGHPWRVLLFPFGNNVDFASLYLEQGYEEGNQKPPEGWYACVQFTLVLWNKHDPSIYTLHTANHRFNAEESDWGFTRFAEIRKLFAPQWEDKGRPMVENDAVNISAYVRIYKDPTGVLWHNFVNYNSKKETGMVGLKNQGATCYLNSLLQSLYFTNAFRKAVYQIPTENESERKQSASAWALQRLFYQLQANDEAVSTQELTLSFGWETKHIFEQQDVQELSRILMERMEERMKGTGAENALAKMFVGRMKTYISCINVDYESSRVEDFWDIQLNVSGNKCLDDSFKDYVQVETMDGENKYFAEGYGLQDAKKGVIFESFPQVLHLQLKRFEYDINRDAMMKVNDRYEFPEIFDASPYLSDTADKSEPYIYKLHGVLVHSGDFNAGHYYAFLKPTADGYFYKFDDDRVTRATMKEALEENFGGDYANLHGNMGVRNPYTRTLSTKRSMSAYMLVYIRQSREQGILHDVSEEDTPHHLAKQLKEERAAIERRRKEREEQHLYLTLGVITEDNFKAYQGFDLTTWDTEAEGESVPKTYRVLRSSTLGDFAKTLAESMNLPAEQVRLWIMVNRQNKTIRPDQPLTDVDMSIEDAYNKYGGRDKSFRLWVEKASEIEDGKPVWPEAPQSIGSNNAPLLVFLKYFDAAAQSLKGVGHIYVKKHFKVAEMVPMITQLMDWTHGTSSVPNGLTNGVTSPPALALYEEIKHSMIEPMKPKATLAMAEIQDGDIVCFQKVLSEKESSTISQTGGYTDAREFYDYLLNRKTVTFSPRYGQEDEGEAFKLDLSRKMSYEQFSAKVGEHLKVEPTHLRFSTVSATTGKAKGTIKRSANQNLSQILYPQFGTYGNNNQRDDILYYEVLEISLSELDTKKNLKVTWVTEGVSKEETFEILVPRLGTVRDLLPGLQKKANIDNETLGNVRIYEAHGSKVYKELSADHSTGTLSEFTTLYAEMIPEEERNAEEGDTAIYCYHFDKESNKPHGVPFKFLVRPGELFKDTKVRLSKRIGLKGKQFDKIKFAVVQRSMYSKPIYLADDDVLADIASSPDDLLGIDHVNRSRGLGGKGDSIFIR
ncbi:ubiquitin-specific protease ubp15 [Lecanora helva]